MERSEYENRTKVLQVQIILDKIVTDKNDHLCVQNRDKMTLQKS